MNTVRICLILFFAAFGGCATPKLMHAELEDAVKDGVPLTAANIAQLSGVTYHATGNLLRIDDHTGDEDPATQDFMGASLPVAAGDRIYIAYPKAGTWGLTRTYLGAKYMPNTRILSDLGVQVKDDRKQFITALGSVLAPFLMAAAPPLVVEVDPKPVFPFVRDAAFDLKCDPLLKDCRAGRLVEFSCLATKGGNSDLVTKKECGKVTYDALPKDAVLRAKYLEAVEDKWTDTFPVPACRSATLILYRWGQPQNTNKTADLAPTPARVSHVILETVVSDPNYVRIVKLPPTGSVAMHSSCGSDVLAGDVVTDPVWAAIAELGAQTKAIKDAQTLQATDKATGTDSAPTQPRN